MKILRVIGSMNPSSGGPCQGIRNSVVVMSQLGVETEVASLDNPLDSFLGKDPFPIYANGPAKGPWNYSSKLIPWLVENLERFDVVIIHGLWLFHGFAVRKALKVIRHRKKNSKSGSNIPKIYVMPHGMLDPYFQTAKGRKIKAIRNRFYWKLIESRIVNEADGILFTCEEELRLAQLPFRPYNPKQEFNVGYGILNPPALNQSMSEEFKKKCPEIKDNPYFLFLGRIHEKKGIDLLIKAYLEVLENISSNEELLEFPRLVIAGPGLETFYGKKIKELASKIEKVHDYVFFVEMLKGEEKWGAFYGCEAFVLPSHQENFGIAVVEALACGKPVLISNQVNIWREIVEANSGLVADDSFEGTKGLLNRWIRLSNNEKCLLGQKGRELFEKSFSVDHFAKRLLTAID